MNAIDLVDVKIKMSFEDFFILFSNLPLNEKEKLELKDYYTIYELFISNGVEPETSWVATKNIFIVKKGPEIQKRMSNEKV